MSFMLLVFFSQVVQTQSNRFAPNETWLARINPNVSAQRLRRAKSADYTGKQLWRKAAELKREVLNDILPKWVHLMDPKDKTTPPSGRTVQDAVKVCL